MKTIGIKLADGSFYPVLQDNMVSEKNLDLTTAHNNQTKVMVDLYRSANCTMDDAEYVDSLQIENLVAHPNGEPDISFSISLDENNELSAKIVDSETGNQSKTTITLVSRTQEERLITDEYNIAESQKKPAVSKKAVAGVGLLAAAAALREKENKTEVEFTPAADMDFSAHEESDEVQESTEVVPQIDEFAEPSTEPSDNLMDRSEAPEEQNLETTEETSSDMDLPDFEAEEPQVEEAIEIPTEETAIDLDLDLPDFPDNSASPEAPAADETIVDDPFALPEDKLASTVEEFPSIEDEDNFPAIEDSSAETLSMDDDFSADNITETSFDDTFDIPDVTTEEEVSMDNNDFPDDFFDIDESKSFNDDVPAGKGLSFTGLYDKETELGTSASYEADDTKKKTKAPVIICIICAIICILATLAVLFIIPSKYNLLSKDKKATAVVELEPIVAPEVEEPEEIKESEPVEVAEPVEAHEAKEEEIVIIEKAEEVVPEQPPVAEEKPKDITYKIKWGDTLWDISETYYKNPWRYKYIARFNKIKNPDYIISGTYITIPAE